MLFLSQQKPLRMTAMPSPLTEWWTVWSDA